MFSAPAPGALPPALAQNPTWQQVNKEINANLKLDLAGTTLSASTKLATIVAGGALPDMLSLGPNPLLANLPAFLEASCADLTPLLSGDAVKAYPNLANYPTYAWQAPGVVYNNKIFAVPVARAIGGNALQVHQQAAAKYDIGPIKSAADFKKALQRATNPKAGVWGISDQTMTFTPLLAAQIFGAPNNWKLESGKLIKDYETEEYKAGIGFLRDLWAAGVYHPYFSTDEGDAFVGGQFVFYYFIEDSFHYSWELVLSKKAVDKLTLIPPFSQDGTSKPQYFLGRGNFGGTVLKKASPDRVKELLSVLNFFGAPFGSQEDLLLTYGIENTDFTFDSMGNPTPKPNGFAKHRVPWA
ncbi:MAG: hypothetical protein ACRDHX_14015, partial [Chloroflexota bacterium]